MTSLQLGKRALKLKKKNEFIWYDCEIPIFIYEMTRLHIMEFCLKLRLAQAEL